MEYQNLKVEHAALIQKLKLSNIDIALLEEGKISKSINIYSPINGYVSKVYVNIGKHVDPSDVIVELIDPSDIHLNLTIFEKDLHQINIGQRVVAYTNTQPDQKYETEVILVNHSMDGGKTEVHCHFKNFDKSLVPGRYMNADLQFNSQRAQFLPEEAVISFEN